MLVPLYMRQPGPVDWVTWFGEFTARDIMEFGLGYGPIYQSYIGLEHVVAGLALMWRRTTTLGALLSMVVMGHAAMLLTGFNHGGTRLDFGLAGPAGHFTLMAIIILAPDWRRLQAFLLNRTAAAPTSFVQRLPRV